MKRKKNSLVFKSSLMTTAFGIIRNRLFKKITKNSLNYFLRGGDLISVNPLTNGVHEPGLTHVISYFCENGYSDFLIDIGANIGLTSCQNGNSFKKVICFEPNPLCVHILKANTEIGITNSLVEINEYGLGNEAGTYDLWVPKHNWGGAFVKNSENRYSDEILASKDSFSAVDKSNYLVKSIDIRSTESVLTEKFSGLIDSGFTSGVVKIDVEGMELQVIQGLARALPSICNIVIVFENWDSNFDFDLIEDAFADRSLKTDIFRSAISDGNPTDKSFIFRRVLQKFSKHKLFPVESSSSILGDVIMVIS